MQGLAHIGSYERPVRDGVPMDGQRMLVGAEYEFASIQKCPVCVKHNTLYFLPVQGSDTNWYKNLLANPTLKISVNGVEASAEGKPITDSNRVGDIIRKFKSKYGEGEVKKYYTNFDVAVEVTLWQIFAREKLILHSFII